MIYRFGQFELDSSTRELRRDGQQVDTEPKAFDLLCYLAGNAERAVSKDELQTELWPRSIVTETALTRCVMKARRAVDDDASRQAVIRTVHGHGYRFVAELESAGADGIASPIAGPTPPRGVAPPEARTRGWYLTVAVAAVLALLALSTLRFTRAPDPPPPAATALAVLPVVNEIADDDLAWVRLGLMSLINRMLDDSGIQVVSDKAVLSMTADRERVVATDRDFLERMRLIAGAELVLAQTLERQGGLFRLSAVLASPSGTRARRVIVGDAPAALASDMARIISEIVAGGGNERADRLSRVSADSFINEAYARGLDLELQGKLEQARAMFEVAAEQEPELFWLRYEIALCTRDLREWDAALEQFDALYEEATLAGDDAARLATLNSRGVLHLKKLEYEAAETPLLEALAIGGETRFARERAAIHVNLALIASNRDDRIAAAEHYDKALIAFDEAGLEPTPTFANNYAGLLISLGELERARQFSENAVNGFRLRGHRRYEASALNRLAKILRRRGDLEAAAARHEEALEIHRELGNALGEAIVLSSMTAIYRARGDLTRARLNTLEARERAVALDHTGLVADSHMRLAQVENDFGNYRAAADEYAAAREYFVGLGELANVRAADEGRAMALLSAGDTHAATGLITRLHEAATGDSDTRALAHVELLRAELDQTLGDGAAARRRFAGVLEDARARDDETVQRRATLRLASLLLDSGDAESAARLLAELGDEAQPSRELTRLRARLAHASGDTASAVAIMTDLRTSAGEAWRSEDAALLSTFNAGND